MSGPSVFSTAGAGVTGLLAVLYGFGVAFGTPLWGESFARFWLWAGALVVGVLFVWFIAVPGLRRLLVP
ncbi:MAG: hypothetical protein Q4F67_07800 [Propionibacteriaceae bacterium]|nr:hypothetical protein [Propionibacteriaceae bacterium]